MSVQRLPQDLSLLKTNINSIENEDNTGGGSNVVHDAGDEDLALGSDELGEDVGQVRHGLVHSTTKDTRVEITARSLDGNLVVGNSTETVGDAGLAVAQPVVVTDADGIDILEPALGLGNDNIIQTLGSVLLHT